MNDTQINPSRRPVARLRDDVARKIAAGEVIDRPYSVVRELLDNSLDSGADTIIVTIENGGLSLIDVTDNGYGMTKEDLGLCWESHATSKIVHEDDLYLITSLGFRGEALSSISSVGKLSITSKIREHDVGHTLSVHGGTLISLEPTSWDRGTKVQVRDLFFNLPARKHFLKKSASEALMCKTAFLEKAVGFPDKTFIFISDGITKLHLLPEQSDRPSVQRVTKAFPNLGDPKLFWQLEGTGENFRFTLVLGSPAVFRKDRKMLQVYANNRRIQEFSLMQAIEYGYQGFMPGGSFPVGFIFLQVDPSSVDFNIHPAKREARFKSIQEIHHRISRTVQDHLHRYAKKTLVDQQRSGLNITTNQNWFPQTNTKPVFDLSVRYNPQSTPQHVSEPGEKSPLVQPVQVQKEILDRETTYPEYRYLGQIFSLFLIVEISDKVLFLDMHAAHEKILFERFRLQHHVQTLLVPMDVELEQESPSHERLLKELSKLGFHGWIDPQGIHFDKIPGALLGKEKLIHDFITRFKGNIEDVERELYATMACRSAVKDGDTLDEDRAHEIIQGALSLDNPRCPHGRPLWFELTRDELFQLVGRFPH